MRNDVHTPHPLQVSWRRDAILVQQKYLYLRFLFRQLPLPVRRRCLGQQRRDLDKIAERGALLIAELRADLGRVHILLALLCWHLLQRMKTLCHCATTIRRQTAQLPHRPANLLPLVRGKSLHRLNAFDRAISPSGRHSAQLLQALVHSLLHLWLQLGEAWLFVERLLLLLQGKTLVLFEPFSQVMLPCRLTLGTCGRWTRRVLILRITTALLPLPVLWMTRPTLTRRTALNRCGMASSRTGLREIRQSAK